MEIYVSEQLIKLIEDDCVNDKSMEKLLSLAHDLNAKYQEQDFIMFHIFLRKLNEYVCSVFNVGRLKEIIDSQLWNKSGHTDAVHYSVQLEDLEKYVRTFFQTYDNEKQKEELSLIESQRLFANNYLHEAHGRHEIILDKHSAPPANQIHLLFTMCHIGLKNQQKMNSQTPEIPKWERGLEYFEETLTKENEEKIYTDFFSQITTGEKPEKYYESTKIAEYIILAKNRELVSYTKQLLGKVKKKNNLNRWAQLSMVHAYAIYKKDRNKAINLYENIYKSTITSLPHLARYAAWSIFHIYVKNMDNENSDKWAKIFQQLPESKPFDDEIGSSKLFNVIYEQSANRCAGRISAGGSSQPVLHAGILSAIKNIINYCSYGFGLMSNITRSIENILKSTVIQSQLSSVNKKESFFITSKWLGIAFSHDGIFDGTLKILIASYSSYFDRRSLFNIAYNSFPDLPYTAHIECLINTVTFAEVSQAQQLKKKVLELYTQEKVKEGYAYISYRANLFRLWLKLITIEKTYFEKDSETLLELLTRAIEKTHCVVFLEELEKVFELIKEKLSKNKINQFKEIVFTFLNEKEHENIKSYFTYCYLILGGEINNIKNIIEPFKLWQTVPLDIREELYPSTERTVLDMFSAAVEQAVSSKSYSSNDTLKNNFHSISYMILKHYEKNEPFSDEAINIVVKLIKSAPVEYTIFVGANLDSFLHKLCVLLNSDIKENLKYILTQNLGNIITEIKRKQINEIHHYEAKQLSPNVLKLYELTLRSFVEKESIKISEVYEVLLNVELHSSFSYTPAAFYFLFKNSGEEIKIFITIYLIYVIKNSPLDSISLFKISDVYKMLYQSSDYAQKVFQENRELLPPSVIEVITYQNQNIDEEH